ncbi:MAG: hypothetical protein JXA95_07665 [Spirochaetales bacterium]|nr:hypothetical protein [Spirochaetales bacterium]
MPGKTDPAQTRLTELLTLLPQLEEEEENLNSRLIGRYLGTSADSIRKDISRLDRGDRNGSYRADKLADDIRASLGLDREVRACLAGLGPLGLHLMEYFSESDDVALTAAFDGKLNRMERLDVPVKLYPAWEMEEIIPRLQIGLGIIATEPEEARKTYRRMVRGGIKAVLNLSGYYIPREKKGPAVKNVNIGAMLLELLCRLS